MTSKMPFKIGWSYKMTIIINCLLCLIGIGLIVFAGVYSAQKAVDGDSIVPLFICGGALFLIGVTSALTGLYHSHVSNPDKAPSFWLAIIVSIILFAVGVALLLFTLLNNDTSIYVQSNSTPLIISGALFCLIGIMSLGVSGWFIGRRNRIGGDTNE